MYRCRWFVLCENVVMDKHSSNLTMVNALSVVRTLSFPTLYAKFSFAAIFDREGEANGPLSLRFVRKNDEKDEILLTVGDDTSSLSSPSIVQFYFNFPRGIRLIKHETVTFCIEAREGNSEWYTVGSQRLRVELLKREAPTPQNAEESEPKEQEHTENL